MKKIPDWLKSILKKFTPKILINIFHKAKDKRLEKMQIENIFTEIKRKNIWGSLESVSGAGSEINQTKTLIMELPKLFKLYNIKSVLDIPCGDFNWMKEVDLSAVEYLGGDIVNELISDNISKYSLNNKEFKKLNIITDELPNKDLIFVRDCFVHLSYNDILKAINNIKKSGCKYLMTTTFEEYHDNHDIITGKWRPLNLQDAPFNFPVPEYLLIEKCIKFENKSMGLWQINNIL